MTDNLKIEGKLLASFERALAVHSVYKKGEPAARIASFRREDAERIFDWASEAMDRFKAMLLALAVLPFLWFTPPAHAGAAIVINHHDYGGSLIDYWAKVADSIQKRRPVQVNAACDSACTLWLVNPDICVGRYAQFRFHQASGGSGGEGTRWMMAVYPPAIREWIERQGGLTSHLITLKGDELYAIVTVCS